MKNLLFLIFFASAGLKAQTIKATTENGKEVLLKSDQTWEYDKNKKIAEIFCELDINYIEPTTDKTMFKSLKVMGVTTDDLKKHV